MNYALKVNSDISTIGYFGDDDNLRESNTAASHALKKAILNINGPTNTNRKEDTKADVREYLPLDTPPKAYRGHAGNQHAAIIASGTVTADNYQEISVKLDNAIAELASVEQIDFDDDLTKYQTERTNIITQMASEGISVVNPERHKRYRDHLKPYSFKYCKHQITIIIWDTVKFNDNCMYDDKRGLYVMIIKGRKVITRNLLTPTELQRVLDSSSLKDRKVKNYRTGTTPILGKVQQSSSGMLRIVVTEGDPAAIDAYRKAEKPTLRWNDIDHLDL